MSHSKSFSLQKIINYIGGTLIFFGVTYFVYSNWLSLNDFFKIFSTLGVALAAYIVGALLYLNKEYDEVGSVFLMIAGLILPVGIFIAFKLTELITGINNLSVVSFSISLVAFLLIFFYFGRIILLLFTIIFASLLFFAVMELITTKLNYFFDDLIAYQLVVLGSSYILLGYYFDLIKKYNLTGSLYFFGVLFILSGSYFLSGILSFDSTLWKMIVGVIILLSFILSVPLQSKSFLYFGAIFLVLFLVDLSRRLTPFFGEAGWPLILISLGFLFILMGSLIFHMQKKIKK
ncbi:MAG: hypothetical protein A3F11_10535 [Gammaproteobacteria bacterium RIFCSPHIGHO2_12_FULL_37_14]|nr:MAG: hypothetical protein A3F11_10535 [Gammaproteobacteria bacterium RIFCSPHIGHO2_12_FULL_37_14]